VHAKLKGIPGRHGANMTYNNTKFRNVRRLTPFPTDCSVF
jgi:hypothetical protein